MEYKSQRQWGWPIAIEIFCGGTAGGTYILSVLPFLLFDSRIFLTGVYASLILVLVSVFVLMAESVSLSRLPKAFLNIKSPLALGAISLSLMIILSIATTATHSTGPTSRALYVLGWFGVMASLLTVLYPGALMGLIKAIPFWSGPALLLLLLSASLVSGSAVIILMGGSSHVGFGLSGVMLGLLAVYGLFLLIYLMLEGQGPKAAQVSVHRLIKGDLFPLFMIGVIAVGLVVPFVLFLFNTLSSSTSTLGIGSVLILIGGVLMRYCFIAGGVKISMLTEDSICATYWRSH